MRRLKRVVKALLQNMDRQHAHILKQLRSGQGDKKNKSKQVQPPVPCRELCPAQNVMRDRIRGQKYPPPP